MKATCTFSRYLFLRVKPTTSFLRFICSVVFCIVPLKLDVRGSVHHTINHTEITNKMQPCTSIYYSNVYQLLNMFRTTHRSSSGAQKLYLQPLVLHTFVDAGSCHDNCQQPQTYVKSEAANTVFKLLMMSGVSLETR